MQVNNNELFIYNQVDLNQTTKRKREETAQQTSENNKKPKMKELFKVCKNKLVQPEQQAAQRERKVLLKKRKNKLYQQEQQAPEKEMKTQHLLNVQQHDYDVKAILLNDDHVVEALGLLFAGFLIGGIENLVNEKN